MNKIRYFLFNSLRTIKNQWIRVKLKLARKRKGERGRKRVEEERIKWENCSNYKHKTAEAESIIHENAWYTENPWQGKIQDNGKYYRDRAEFGHICKDSM